jgi:hypothetical protein
MFKELHVLAGPLSDKTAAQSEAGGGTMRPAIWPGARIRANVQLAL